MEKFSIVPNFEIVVGEKSEIEKIVDAADLAKETEERIENLGFRIIRRGDEKPYSWIIITPSGRQLMNDDLRKFYNNLKLKLEFGNREHMENLQALEYLEALQILYDDVNENVF